MGCYSMVQEELAFDDEWKRTPVARKIMLAAVRSPTGQSSATSCLNAGKAWKQDLFGFAKGSSLCYGQFSLTICFPGSNLQKSSPVWFPGKDAPWLPGFTIG